MSDFKPIFDGVDSHHLYIAGPCSAESREQVLEAARGIKAAGIGIMRAGVWKPRTRPGSFEGMGAVALKWLQEAKQEYGLKVVTEIASPEHLEAALRAGIDGVWIGARTTTNPFAVQEIADALRGCDVPVLVKNPVNPDIELWIGGIQRIYNAGLRKIGAIHRGFSNYDEKVYRNSPQWHIPIELRRRFPNLPIFCDPSHIGGKRDFVAPLSQHAMDMGFDGLIIETHCSPDYAWSDKNQQITPGALDLLLDDLIIRDVHTTTEDLGDLRKQIDILDNELIDLLAKRMRVSREIGKFKKEHKMTVLQAARYDEILKKRVEQAEAAEMKGEFMLTVMQAIHEESVRQQMEIINK